MYWTGTGITSTQVKILPDFRVDTKPALKWIQSSDGNWVCADRGTAADIYETEFTVAGKQAYVESIISLVDTNRFAAATDNLITLGAVEATENMFGEDVVHNSLTMTITSVGKIEQRSWQAYGVSLRARAVSPSFVGSAGLPAFRNILVGKKTTVDSTITKLDSYYGVFTNLDGNFDTGSISLTVAMTLANIQAFRRMLMYTRGGDYSLHTASGAWNLFGPTRGGNPTTPVPIAIKITDWEDAGWFGLTHRLIRLTLVEVT